MSKPKAFVKEETVRRIRKLLSKYKTKEKLINSEEFISLETHYINGYEREHLDEIVNLIVQKKSYDEIRYTLKGDIHMKNKKVVSVEVKPKVTEDPVEKETEGVFMISQQRVVDVDENVSVIIGGQNEAEEESVNDETGFIKSEMINIEDDEAEESVNASEDEVVLISELGRSDNDDESPDFTPYSFNNSVNDDLEKFSNKFEKDFEDMHKNVDKAWDKIRARSQKREDFFAKLLEQSDDGEDDIDDVEEEIVDEVKASA